MGKVNLGVYAQCIKKGCRCSSILENCALYNGTQVWYVSGKPIGLASRQSVLKTKHSFLSGVAFHNELAQAREWVKEGRDISSCRNLIKISDQPKDTAMKKVERNDRLAAGLVLEHQLFAAHQDTAGTRWRRNSTVTSGPRPTTRLTPDPRSESHKFAIPHKSGGSPQSLSKKRSCQRTPPPRVEERPVRFTRDRGTNFALDTRIVKHDAREREGNRRN